LRKTPRIEGEPTKYSATAVYRRCLAEIGVAPEETLFIDDSVANVAGARAAGLVGVSVS